MPNKNQPLRIIDQKLPYVGGGASINAAGETIAAAVAVNLVPPTLLTVGSAFVSYSDLTPTAVVNLSWRAPAAGPQPVEYQIQWSADALFTAPVTRRTGRQGTSAALDGLPTNTTLYLRVAAVYAQIGPGPQSASVSTTTPQDTTPPDAPTALTTAWSSQTGDLTITWTNPTSRNLRDVRVRIYASSGGALLRTVFSRTGRYVWTRGQHEADTAGSYDPAVSLSLTAYSVANVASVSDLTGSATLTAPASPTGLTHTWAGDAGAAGSDLSVMWAAAGVAGYRLTLDGVTRNVGTANRYTYTLATNAAEHSGAPDPAVGIALVAVDALGQTSAAATATATNAAPPPTTLTAAGNFSTFSLTIGASAAADLADYRVRAYLNGAGAPSQTLYTRELLLLYEPPGTGSWRFDVAPRDAFGQLATASALTTAAATTSLTAFVADLRAAVTYTDSVGTAPATLAGLKDGNLATNVVTYASSTPWRWTQADRQQADRHRTTTLATSASASYYLGTSKDGVSYAWYAGGTASGGVWLPVAQASEAAAQAAATTLAAGTWRIDLPTLTQARLVRLGHRNTGASYALREFFPRSRVEADDIAAQAITAEKIAVGTITGDRIAAGTITAGLITVSSLSALSANMGTITAGTVTGATIRTAASGARAELTSAGLKTYDSTGTVQVEATTATNGALKTANGLITLSTNSGIVIDSSGAQSYNRAIHYTDMDGSETVIRRSEGIAEIFHEVTTLLPGRLVVQIKNRNTSNNVALVLGQNASDGLYRTHATITGAGLSLGPAPTSLGQGDLYVGETLTVGAGKIFGESWIAPTLLNSWINYPTFSTAAYWKDALNVVHLRGLVAGGALSTTIFTLPVGYRPPAQALFGVHVSGGAGRVDVTTAGNVIWVAGSSSSFVQLDGITFRAS